MTRLTVIITLCVLLVASTTALGAAYDMFLQVDGIPGTADCPGHRDFIKVGSFSLAPAVSGRVDHAGFTVTKRFDSASPKLARYAETSRNIPGAELHLYVYGYEKTVFSFSFEKVEICEVQRNDLSEFHAGLLGERPDNIEQVRFRCGEIHWEYSPTTEGKSKQVEIRSNIRAKYKNRSFPARVFGMGTSNDDIRFRFGFLGEQCPPSRLLWGQQVSAVGCALLSDGEGDEPIPVLPTGETSIVGAGDIHIQKMDIPSEDNDRSAVILSPIYKAHTNISVEPGANPTE